MKNCNYLLGLDLGTTNIKGIVLSETGEIISLEKMPVSYENNNIEYDVVEFYDMVAQIIKNLADKVDNSDNIKAICMVSASGNTTLLDANLKPLRKAFSWTDRRFTNEADIVLGNPDYTALYDMTGWPFYNSFPLAHLSWLKLNEPEKLNTANYICMVTDYVNFRLSGSLATNPSTATTFYLMNQKTGGWSGHITDKLGINSEKLPKIIHSGEIIGFITDESSEKTGLSAGTPVVAGSFDHPGAARGLGILDEGSLLLSCGTSWVGFYPSKNRERLISLKMLVDPFMKNTGCWAGMFSLPGIGNNIDTLIKRWISNDEESYELFNKLAGEAMKGSGGLTINPMEDTGADFGSHKKQDICRAIMEGTALLMKNNIDKYAENGLKADKIAIAGGPTHSYPWMKILCDILGTDIAVADSHSGARGAAVMAGIGAGLFKDEYDAGVKMNFGV